jgi:valyl-tRNA synthetase
MKDYKLKKTELIATDRIFLSALNELIVKCTDSFEKYEYSRAKSDADLFFWSSLCDNYLEIVKNRVYNGTKEERESASFTLYSSLLTILKLMAPFTPFITEEIYQKYFRGNEKTKSIHISEWPREIQIEKKKEDKEVYDLMIEVLGKVRQEKSIAKKSMNSSIILTLDKKEKETLDEVLDDLKSVTNASEIKTGKFKVEFVE